MMRPVVGGLALVVLACAAAAQPLDKRAQFALHERHRDIELAYNERLTFLGEKLFFDVRLSGTGRTACASCHDPAYAFAEPRRSGVGRAQGRTRQADLPIRPFAGVYRSWANRSVDDAVRIRRGATGSDV